MPRFAGDLLFMRYGDEGRFELGEVPEHELAIRTCPFERTIGVSASR